MQQARNTKSLMMMIVLGVIFVLIAGVTIFAAMSFVRQPDRGFMFWMTTGFILFIETLIFAGAMGLLAGKGSSTPIILANTRVVLILGVVGLASIIIYHVIRDPDAPADKAFGAVMAIEVTVAIAVIILLRAWDTYFNAMTAPIAAQRREHAVKGRSLQAQLVRLRGLSWTDNELAMRADRILKRLEAAQGALAHSHGGGGGSREAGQLQAVRPEDDEQIQSLLGQLDSAVSDLERGQDVAAGLSQAETLASRLSGQISAMQLD
jgi:hypothetical protein